MSDFNPTEYKLVCVATGQEFDDNGWSLDYEGCKTPSLIRANYANKQLTVRDDENCGLYKFRDWLPVKRMLKCSASPVTYRSEGLAKALGLENLYITFNGYFPERGANMQTCSFKESPFSLLKSSRTFLNCSNINSFSLSIFVFFFKLIIKG